MEESVKTVKSFNPDDLQYFEPEAKVGLVATVTPEGLPHLTMITSLQAKSPTELTWGQFTEGQSKLNVRENPKTGFAIMTMDRKIWRGKALWTHTETEGDDYVMYNNKPMFRYNSYFGIHTVHYMDLVETTPGGSLPLAKIVAASMLTKIAKKAAATGNQDPILKPFAHQLFDNMSSVSFIGYVDADGFPQVIPLIQCQAADSRRLAFSPIAYREELKQIPEGQDVAVFCMSMEAEDVVVRGKFGGFKKYRGISLGTVDIDWVYNSMPPKQGQIYPEVPLAAVVNF
jgi:Pyridoxamine 5'-phosphate oxidase